MYLLREVGHDVQTHSAGVGVHGLLDCFGAGAQADSARMPREKESPVSEDRPEYRICRDCGGHPRSLLPPCDACDGGWQTWCSVCLRWDRENHACHGMADCCDICGRELLPEATLHLNDGRNVCRAHLGESVCVGDVMMGMDKEANHAALMDTILSLVG